MTATRIQPSDIEAKLRRITDEVHRTTESAKPVGMAVAGVAVVGVLALAYLMGRRRGKRQRTVVEVRRV
ncbi:MAG TPA: hypothetical protein VE990_07300 [Acidimicrobiales bacterium]|nr:hypothetical protein [Acidimicrobiales bacterium]